MIYFFIEIIIYTLLIISIFSYFNYNKIGVLEFLIMLFILNVYICFLYNDLNILYSIIISVLVICIKELYTYLEKYNYKKKSINSDKVLINRGLIKFNELVNNQYDYNTFIKDLKKRGFNPNSIDYCVKRGNDLIIFKKDNINNYPISIIIDGVIIADNLYSIKKDSKWLEKAIKDNNLILDDVNYAYYKNNHLHFVTNM